MQPPTQNRQYNPNSSMDSVQVAGIEQELSEIPDRIEKASDSSITAKQDYAEAKANYDNQYALAYMRKKLENSEATQGDLDSYAVTESHSFRMEMIKKQSIHLRAQKDVDKIKDEFDALKERSYNLRASINAFR